MAGSGASEEGHDPATEIAPPPGGSVGGMLTSFDVLDERQRKEEERGGGEGEGESDLLGESRDGVLGLLDPSEIGDESEDFFDEKNRPLNTILIDLDRG
ncbi:uncharacterized protein A4U43_C07F35840 [Asparagus officinalis]|uniref:Uncharacterized protein n=1 Tax=Asparagus officinalis TaxID=4686 RepID=A0A5P1EHU0_ASPOF|nr:uncharacterized protein A4U43_C07F35840 [Asparagus officinalis]